MGERKVEWVDIKRGGQPLRASGDSRFEDLFVE